MPAAELPEQLREETLVAAQAVLLEAISQGAFPGAAFGVLHRGAVVALGSAGHFTYDAHSPAVAPGTSYDLASVSKVVATTAMAMLLWQRGKLVLDTLLADVLPGFLIGSEHQERQRRRRVTLRMLLAHASGLPSSIPFYERCGTREQLLRAVLQVPLEAEPGERTAYSDPGFMLLGLALELIAGSRLENFATKEIFAPLGMRETRYRPAAGTREQIPPTEQDNAFRRRTVQGEVHDENCFLLGGVSGHAGLFAPALDLLRFAEAMLAPLREPAREHPEHALFTAAAVQLFTQRAELPPGSSRALGWDTPSAGSSSGGYFSASSFGHLGFTGTSLWIDPAQDLAVALLTNRTFPTRENKKIQEVRPRFHDTIMRALRHSTLA